MTSSHGIDTGFDMVPSLSNGAVDRQNWHSFIKPIKEQYAEDNLVKIKDPTASNSMLASILYFLLKATSPCVAAQRSEAGTARTQRNTSEASLEARGSILDRVSNTRMRPPITMASMVGQKSMTP